MSLSRMRLRSLALLAVVLVFGLGSCRARWRPAGPEIDRDLASGGRAAPNESEPSGEAAEACRDFPLPLGVVWSATVEAVHTAGVPVPRSAHCSDLEGVIDVEPLWVRLVSRGAESTRVLVRYRDPAGEAGAESASELLDEVGRRARSLHSKTAGER